MAQRSRKRRSATVAAARMNIRQNGGPGCGGLNGRHKKPNVILRIRIVMVVVTSAANKSITKRGAVAENATNTEGPMPS